MTERNRPSWFKRQPGLLASPPTKKKLKLINTKNVQTTKSSIQNDNNNNCEWSPQEYYQIKNSTKMMIYSIPDKTTCNDLIELIVLAHGIDLIDIELINSINNGLCAQIEISLPHSHKLKLLSHHKKLIIDQNLLFVQYYFEKERYKKKKNNVNNNYNAAATNYCLKYR